MSAFLLLWKEDGRKVEQVPFVTREGHMIEAIKEIAAHITDVGIAELFYEKVAGDRLEIILNQEQKLRELEAVIADLRIIADLSGYPTLEAVR